MDAAPKVLERAPGAVRSANSVLQTERDVPDLPASIAFGSRSGFYLGSDPRYERLVAAAVSQRSSGSLRRGSTTQLAHVAGQLAHSGFVSKEN
jgi:hypothetical protein